MENGWGKLMREHAEHERTWARRALPGLLLCAAVVGVVALAVAYFAGRL